MRPKPTPKADHADLFRAGLEQIINRRHELVLLAKRIDWAWIEEQIVDDYADEGRPAEPVRFMIGMFFLKHRYGLSDERSGTAGCRTPISSTSPARNSSNTYSSTNARA